MTVKNTKIQLQFRKAARLMDKNNRLAAENTALKQKLQEQTPLVQAAEKYRDEHRNILNALAKAETGYRNAALELTAAAKEYQKRSAPCLSSSTHA